MLLLGTPSTLLMVSFFERRLYARGYAVFYNPLLFLEGLYKFSVFYNPPLFLEGMVRDPGVKLMIFEYDPNAEPSRLFFIRGYGSRPRSETHDILFYNPLFS